MKTDERRLKAAAPTGARRTLPRRAPASSTVTIGFRPSGPPGVVPDSPFYQIFTRSSGARHIPSPSFTSKAL